MGPVVIVGGAVVRALDNHDVVGNGLPVACGRTSQEATCKAVIMARAPYARYTPLSRLRCGR